MNMHERYELRRIVNAAGTMTYLGSSCVSPRVAEAMSSILPEFVDMRELQRAACGIIATATGSEAGCVTASAAAGISVAVAACMTGTDLCLIERLPDTSKDDMKNEVIVLKGHAVGFGASLSQMIRLTGAACIEIGTVTQAGGYQLRGAIGSRTAAVVYVVSHHTVQSGLIGLRDVCAIAAERGVPVIVDAASEYDLRGFLEAGAQLVVYSGHKFLGGPTSGIIAGDLRLVRACYMQERGIGRSMKVGKESIVGIMEALLQWQERDAGDVRLEEEARIDYALLHLGALRGVRVERVADPTGNPITRLQVWLDPMVCGLSAFELSNLLSAGELSVRVRAHEAELGFFQIDPCNLKAGEIELVCSRITELLANPSRPELPTRNATDFGYLSLLRWPD
ncbi:PLP-dependent transferase [Paenibacillus mendelii]|uniref:PLP-dependent transferase n=1 Tax=Paenibacillus mendelii TaxID=206163 RepID=A0ABV6JFJ7_9BACL|nr:PLP-dependent transferase [Paenibacillus mendelii]MCQ6561635.1 PLP-dependent transferase [Paenibacillus mendelii]